MGNVVLYTASFVMGSAASTWSLMTLLKKGEMIQRRLNLQKPSEAAFISPSCLRNIISALKQ